MADPSTSELDEFLVELASALLRSGETVDEVQMMVTTVATANGQRDVDIVALPTATLIQVGLRPTTVRSVDGPRLRLDQISDIYGLAHRAMRGEVAPADGIQGLAEIGDRRPPFGPVTRSLGLGLLAVGFALILQPTVSGVFLAFTLGTLVGAVLLIPVPEIRAVLPTLMSFLVALVVFSFAGVYQGENPIRLLIAPLVVFLPGAAITAGTMELAARQTVSGASRLVAGLVDLLLLAIGIVAAALLVSAPPIDLIDRPQETFGWWSSPLGLLFVAAGNHLHFCAKRTAVPWILLVLSLAYAGQTLGAYFFSPEISAFFGAVVMTPVVLALGDHDVGPPTMVLFLPAFWLLVPGATGLIGVSQIVGTNATLGAGSFNSTMITVLAIALGILLATAVMRAGTRLARGAGPVL